MTLAHPPYDADDFPVQMPLPFACLNCGECDERTRLGGLYCLDCFVPRLGFAPSQR